MSDSATEPTVTIDSLDASLDDLLKAADATDLKSKLSKAYGGVSIEHGGHYTEGKQKGGGAAGAGDIGGIDNMMIAKMTASLANAGFSEAQITAFMRGKAEEDADEPDEDDEDEGGDYEDEDEPDFGKSDRHDFAKSFREDSVIAEAIDAAPFMESLTAKTTKALDAIAKSQTGHFKTQSKVNRAMAGALYQQGQLIKALSARLGIIERAPNPPKGRTGAAPLHKSMPGEAGVPQGQLRKSEALATLNYMSLIKGQKTIGGEPVSIVISKLESAGMISDEAIHEVQKFLATHPSEAAAAKAYV